MIEGIIFIVHWMPNPNACSRCLALTGKEWEIQDLDEAPQIFALFSHPHCKCELDVEVIVDLEKLQIG